MSELELIESALADMRGLLGTWQGPSRKVMQVAIDVIARNVAMLPNRDEFLKVCNELCAVTGELRELRHKMRICPVCGTGVQEEP